MNEILKNKILILNNRIKKYYYNRKNLRKCLLKKNSLRLEQISFQISIMLLIIFFLSISSLKVIKIKNLSFDYEIRIIIEDGIEQRILADEFSNLPSQIYINDSLQSSIERIYNLYNGTNEIKMNWNTTVESLAHIFNNCRNISSIDLSNFDSSSVTDMNSMFSNCVKLKKIDFTDFNTSSVNNMANLFTSFLLIEIENYY